MSQCVTILGLVAAAVVLHLRRILDEVTSVFATVGRSTGTTAQLEPWHQVMGCMFMFIGARLGTAPALQVPRLTRLTRLTRSTLPSSAAITPRPGGARGLLDPSGDRVMRAGAREDLAEQHSAEDDHEDLRSMGPRLPAMAVHSRPVTGKNHSASATATIVETASRRSPSREAPRLRYSC